MISGETFALGASPSVASGNVLFLGVHVVLLVLDPPTIVVVAVLDSSTVVLDPPAVWVQLHIIDPIFEIVSIKSSSKHFRLSKSL